MLSASGLRSDRMRNRNKGLSFAELLIECMKRNVEVRGSDGKYKPKQVLEKELLVALEKEKAFLERMKRFAERNSKK